jgi:hypothetical protein
MYGAEYLPEGAWVHYVVPELEPKEKADIFLGLVFAVEMAEGWSVASVGNEKWHYSTPNGEPVRLQTFTCKLSFGEYLPGVPAARFVFTAPGGERLEGGITYKGDWIPVRRSSVAQEGDDGLFKYEANLPQDAFAIEANDITGDGNCEMVVACDGSLRVYRRAEDYLELRYMHSYNDSEEESLYFGELGYLGALKQDDGWRFYIRGPSHKSTSVFELRGGSFSDLNNQPGIPLTSMDVNERLIIGQAKEGYHIFQPDGLLAISPNGGVTMGVPDPFTFLAVGNFDGTPELETAYLDNRAAPHLLVDSDIFMEEYPWGAGLWAFDVDSDGYDELVTTGRKMSSDHLEFHKFGGGVFRLVEVSPEFEGRILDVAFADFDGDGEDEPAVLIAFGRERRLIF